MADITSQLFVQRCPTDRLKLVGVEVFTPKKSGKHRKSEPTVNRFGHYTDKPGKEEEGREELAGRASVSKTELMKY